MPRLPESIANPENAAVVRANIATDEATRVVWTPSPQSDVTEYSALATGSFSFFNVSDYIPVFLETGSIYTISARGTVEPSISIVDGEGYTYITIDGDDVPGGLSRDDHNEDSIFFFEPDFTGLHYLNMGPLDPQFFGANTDYAVIFTEDRGGDLFNLFADDFDIPGDASSTRTASVGNDFQGFLGDGAEGGSSSANTDIDYINISLTAGQSYEVVVQSTSLKPYTGVANFQNVTVNFDQDTAAVFTYTATRTGDHALLLNGSSSGASDFGAGGTFRVSLTETGDDHPDIIGSNTTVVPGVATTGNLETVGDKDVFKVSGIAGTIYTIELRGAPSSLGTLTDPLVRVLDSSGSQVARDDDGGTGLESNLTYTPTTTGNFYIEAGAFSSNHTGTYQIDVSSTAISTPTNPDSGAFIPDVEASRAIIRTNIANDGSIEAVRKIFFDSTISDFSAIATGSLSSFNVADYIPVFLEVGDLYNFSVTSTDKPSIFLHDENGNTFLTVDPDDASGANPDDSTEDSIIAFTPHFTGLHYVNIGPEDPAFAGLPSSYTLTITQDVFSDGINNLYSSSDRQVPGFTGPSGDDISHGFNQGQPIVAGQSFTSSLNSGPVLGSDTGIRFKHDRDIVSISLLEGKTYDIEAVGNGFPIAFNFGVGTDSSSIIQIGPGLGSAAPGKGETASITFQSFMTQSYGINVFVDNIASGAGGVNTPVVAGGQYTISVQETTDLANAYVKDGVYRFFNTDTGTHFYSASWNERNIIVDTLTNFNLEGPSFKAADTANGPTASVYRFFNTDTGTHFFTQSTVERDSIIENLPSFNLEGEAYLGYTEQVAGSTPLYRFFNTDTGTHFYTAAEAEKDSIISNLPNFNFEGTAYWVDPVMG